MGWLVLPFAMMMTAMGFSVGSPLGVILSLVLAVLVAPPIWSRFKINGHRTYGPARWSAALGIAFVSMMVNGAAYSETPEGRAAEARRMAGEQAKQDREADELAAGEALKTTARQEKMASGEHCLSGWDGSLSDLKSAVRKSLRNPSSFEHIETVRSPADADGRFGLIMTFRAENGFGGMNVEAAGVEVDARTCDWRQVEPEALARRLPG